MEKRVGLKLSELQHKRLKILSAFQGLSQGAYVELLLNREYQSYLESVDISKKGGKHERN
jgi:hypothetical protein